MHTAFTQLILPGSYSICQLILHFARRAHGNQFCQRFPGEDLVKIEFPGRLAWVDKWDGDGYNVIN